MTEDSHRGAADDGSSVRDAAEAAGNGAPPTEEVTGAGDGVASPAPAPRRIDWADLVFWGLLGLAVVLPEMIRGRRAGQ